jgi:hypothetical protein
MRMKQGNRVMVTYEPEERQEPRQEIGLYVSDNWFVLLIKIWSVRLQPTATGGLVCTDCKES